MFLQKKVYYFNFFFIIKNYLVVEKALSGDISSNQALYFHYKYLFRSAKQQCVGLQTKGIFLAGDNQVILVFI